MNKISTIVRDILKKNRINSFPINLKKITASLKVQIKKEKLENDISGFLYLKDNKSIIVVNDSHPEVRQRFTIAHELGHLLLNHNSDLFVDNENILYRATQTKDANYKLEKEANKFAAELLMPEEMLTDELLKGEIFLDDTDELNKLANKLQVSPQALTIRLSNLGWTLF